MHHADYQHVLWDYRANVLRESGTQPAHVHVYYQDLKAIFDIQTGDVTSGELPPRQTRLVQAWIELHHEELVAD